VKLHIDAERCQGHGRCYDLAPDLFGDDDEGFGQVLGDGTISPEPERAIELLEES
jgi:ferredoxin